MTIDVNEILQQQREFFENGRTLSLDFRLQQLKKLKLIVQKYENDIAEALKKDLNKSRMEAIATEVILVIEEIDLMLKNLKKWMRPQKTKTPFPLLWPGSSTIQYDPYGTVLIIGPWNYPFLLIFSPLIGAISAGNCAIVKPSEVASHTQTLILNLLKEYFEPPYIAGIEGGPTEMENILQHKYDYIFFTGGTSIGKIIMSAAAKQLTPVTLELGGKSPCIVDESANIAFAARRIAWAKTTNAGQTCIAPDYLFIHENCKEKFIQAYIQAIKRFYGDQPELSDSYGRIINTKHFDRIVHLMEKQQIIYGGQTNRETLYIAPTLLADAAKDHPILQEEIFGPLLPIIPFKKMTEVFNIIKQHPKPLSLYLFTKDRITEDSIIRNLSFGGGCINDCMLHTANAYLPFGGVGLSGLGHYHGEYSFKTFSHQKSIYKKTLPIDFNLQYPPYNDQKLHWLKKLLSFS